MFKNFGENYEKDDYEDNDKKALSYNDINIKNLDEGNHNNCGHSIMPKSTSKPQENFLDEDEGCFSDSMQEISQTLEQKEKKLNINKKTSNSRKLSIGKIEMTSSARITGEFGLLQGYVESKIINCSNSNMEDVANAYLENSKSFYGDSEIKMDLNPEYCYDDEDILILKRNRLRKQGIQKNIISIENISKNRKREEDQLQLLIKSNDDDEETNIDNSADGLKSVDGVKSMISNASSQSTGFDVLNQLLWISGNEDLVMDPNMFSPNDATKINDALELALELPRLEENDKNIQLAVEKMVENNCIIGLRKLSQQQIGEEQIPTFAFSAGSNKRRKPRKYKKYQQRNPKKAEEPKEEISASDCLDDIPTSVTIMAGSTHSNVTMPDYTVNSDSEDEDRKETNTEKIDEEIRDENICSKQTYPPSELEFKRLVAGKRIELTKLDKTEKIYSSQISSILEESFVLLADNNSFFMPKDHPEHQYLSEDLKNVNDRDNLQPSISKDQPLDVKIKCKNKVRRKQKHLKNLDEIDKPRDTQISSILEETTSLLVNDDALILGPKKTNKHHFLGSLLPLAVHDQPLENEAKKSHKREQKDKNKKKSFNKDKECSEEDKSDHRVTEPNVGKLSDESNHMADASKEFSLESFYIESQVVRDNTSLNEALNHKTTAGLMNEEEKKKKKKSRWKKMFKRSKAEHKDSDDSFAYASSADDELHRDDTRQTTKKPKNTIGRRLKSVFKHGKADYSSSSESTGDKSIDSIGSSHSKHKNGKRKKRMAFLKPGNSGNDSIDDRFHDLEQSSEVKGSSEMKEGPILDKIHDDSNHSDRIYGLVIQIQSHVRGYIARNQWRHETESSIKLQSVWRSYECKKVCQNKRNNCILLQAHVRRYLVQQNVAYTEPAFVRNVDGVDRAELVSAQKKLCRDSAYAIVCQSLIRGHIARKKWKTTKMCVITLQLWWRSCHHKVLEEEIVWICIFIQSHTRRYLVQQRMKTKKASCILCQSIIRRYLVERQVQELRGNATIIQKHWRSHYYESKLLTNHQQRRKDLQDLAPSKNSSTKERQEFDYMHSIASDSSSEESSVNSILHKIHNKDTSDLTLSKNERKELNDVNNITSDESNDDSSEKSSFDSSDNSSDDSSDESEDEYNDSSSSYSNDSSEEYAFKPGTLSLRNSEVSDSESNESKDVSFLSEQLFLLINCKPEKTTPACYNDARVNEFITKNPEICGMKYDFDFTEEEIYPLQMLCSIGGSIDTVKRCYDAYKDAAYDDESQSRTAAHSAVIYSASSDVLEFLFFVEPGLRLATDENGMTPLHSACKIGVSLQILKILVSKEDNSSARVKDNNGNLPLHLAAENDFTNDLIDSIISAYPKGCNECNNASLTPLHLAINRDRKTDTIKKFLKGGPKSVKIVDNIGQTPLHIAVSAHACLSTVKLLCLFYPKAIQIRSALGETPYNLALRIGAHKRIKMALKCAATLAIS